MAAFDRAAGPGSTCRSLMRIGAFVLLCGIPAASATTITVDSTADDTATNGNCTLREAVIAANTDAAVDDCPAGSGADVIVVPAGAYGLTLAGTGEDAAATGDLDVTADVEIQGAGAATTAIDANHIDRVFDFDPGDTGITAELTGVIVRNGSQVIEGGGIRNAGTLTLADSTVTANAASSDTATPARGGGIRNSGSLTVTNSTLTENTAAAFSIMVSTTGEGGGIFSDGSAVITTSTLDDNTVFAGLIAHGAGIDNTGTLSVDRSVISNNDASTFEGDETFGGGIASSGMLTLTNSTISGNTVADMGAVLPSNFGAGLSLGGTATISNCTIANNSGGLFTSGGVSTYGTATFRNTIIANNAGGDCEYDTGGGTHVADAYNLDSDNTCGFSGTDLVGVDPLLGPLQDNGGPTLTHLLLTGSPALEAGNPALPGSGGNACESTDQRGVARPQRVRCDIGSVEVESCPAAPLPGCAAAGKSSLLIKDRDGDGAGPKDKLMWKWLKGPAAPQSAFGDPTASAIYTLCVYTGTAQALTIEALVPPAGTCGSAPCWQAIGTKGYRRSDPMATTAGIAKITLKGGDASSKIIVKGKDGNLPLTPATLPLDVGDDVIVQLSNSENMNCWQSALPASAVARNVDTIFKAKTP